jgi:hypothetical protein
MEHLDKTLSVALDNSAIDKTRIVLLGELVASFLHPIKLAIKVLRHTTNQIPTSTILGTTEPVLQPLYARQGDEAHTVHTTTTAAATVEQTASSAVSKMNTFAGKESNSDAQRQETERIEHTADDSANSETNIAATTLASVPVSKSSATK